MTFKKSFLLRARGRKDVFKCYSPHADRAFAQALVAIPDLAQVNLRSFMKRNSPGEMGTTSHHRKKVVRTIGRQQIISPPRGTKTNWPLLASYSCFNEVKAQPSLEVKF